MGLIRIFMIFFAIAVITVIFSSMFSVMIVEKPGAENSIYYMTNQSINATTGATEALLRGGPEYSSVALLFAAILFFGAAAFYMAGKRR